MSDQVKQFIRVEHLAHKLSISKSTAWAWVADGRLPAPIKLGPRISIWDEGVVNLFMDSLVAQNHKPVDS